MRHNVDRPAAITFTVDGTPVCVPGDWECRMWKPYPKTSHEYPSWGMMARWDAGPEPQP